MSVVRALTRLGLAASVLLAGGSVAAAEDPASPALLVETADALVREPSRRLDRIQHAWELAVAGSFRVATRLIAERPWDPGLRESFAELLRQAREECQAVVRSLLAEPARLDPGLARVAELYLEWLLRTSGDSLAGRIPRPGDLPLPRLPPVVRFLGEARRPDGGDDVVLARMRALAFLDRLGFFEALVGRPLAADAPAFATWIREGAREPVPAEARAEAGREAGVWLVRADAAGIAPSTLAQVAAPALASTPPLKGHPPSLLRRILVPMKAPRIRAASRPPGDGTTRPTEPADTAAPSAAGTTASEPASTSAAISAAMSAATTPAEATTGPATGPTGGIEPGPSAASAPDLPPPAPPASPHARRAAPDPVPPPALSTRAALDPARAGVSPLAWLFILLLAPVGFYAMGRELLGGRDEPPPGPPGPVPVLAPAAYAQTLVSTPPPPASPDPAATRAASGPEPAAPPPGFGLPAGSPLPVWLAASLASVLGERYTGLRLLGSGGMGTVVAACDARLGRLVAIKVLPPPLATVPGFRERFLREARALARLGHPNIPVVYDVPEVGPADLPVMIREYLDGTTLELRLERQGTASAAEVAGWVAQAAAGLAHAHALSIAHRDVKPGNLLLAGGKVYLLDFGLAVMDGEHDLTHSGVILGSLPYMAPELFAGGTGGPASDQYALAATAYELLSGALPFGAQDRVRATLPPLSSHRPGLDPGLDPVFARALSADPAARFPDVTALAEALAAAARPPVA